ncbi:MAG: NUDIX hydrolase [Planctomycetota bacterium]|jgi:NADH pyrophosphatase NudC (nudix superfamily)
MDKNKIKHIGENPNAKLFQYCPRCGGDKLAAATVKSFECPDCGFGFFLNTAAAVGALITDGQGRLLVTVRKAEPAKGTWDLPGGFTDPGESVEETVRREIKEELGLDIISMRYFCSFPNIYEFGGRRWTMWRRFCS